MRRTYDLEHPVVAGMSVASVTTHLGQYTGWDAVYNAGGALGAALGLIMLLYFASPCG